MAHNLYRFYLYVVFIAMVIFAAVGLGTLLQTLLALTPLRDSNSPAPPNAEIVQSVVFAGVAWLIAALLGGLHYWLIRRDMQNDPAAAGGPIRAFFLNIVELIATPLAVGLSAYGVIMQLGNAYAGNLSAPAAFSIATLSLVGFLEWERQRTQASPGVPMVFQRLHLYGVQLVLLLLLTSAWLPTVSQLVDAFVFGGKGASSYGGSPPCSGFTVCQGTNLLSMAAGTLWIMLFWVGYGFFSRHDTSSLLRQILHFASFAYGVGYLLAGIYRGLELLLLTLAFKVSVSPGDIVGQYDFVSPLTFGLIVIGIYSIWLRYAARQRPEGPVTVALTAEVIAAALLAGVFWWGIGNLLRNGIEAVFPAGAVPQSSDWASAIAFAIAGLAYILLDLFLRQRNIQDAATAAGPRRGFVFAMIGAGALAGAIGGAVALYALVTSLLGSPLSNWQQVARSGLSAFVVGIIVAGLYLFIANREHLFSGLVKPQGPAPTPTPKPVTVEGVLDALLAGKITRDEAAERIRAIASSQPLEQSTESGPLSGSHN